jgi:hypothetical protein
MVPGIISNPEQVYVPVQAPQTLCSVHLRFMGIAEMGLPCGTVPVPTRSCGTSWSAACMLPVTHVRSRLTLPACSLCCSLLCLQKVSWTTGCVSAQTLARAFSTTTKTLRQDNGLITQTPPLACAPVYTPTADHKVAKRRLANQFARNYQAAASGA